MRTDRERTHYWTLMNAAGFICEMPRTLRRVLDSDDWVSMDTKGIVNAQS